MPDSVLTLRGRVARVHDCNPDRSITATFQGLPGASFVVGGAAQASDAALTTVSIERKWSNGFSLAATFEGDFFQCHPQLRRQRRGAVCVVRTRRFGQAERPGYHPLERIVCRPAPPSRPAIAGYCAGARQCAARRAVAALCFMSIGQLLCA